MPMLTAKLEHRNISTLKLRAADPHKHSAAQIEKLRASLREFGFVSPVLISADGTVWAGQGRIMAARAEELDTAPCVLIEHLTPEQMRAYALADNRLAEEAEWDNVLLSNELLALADLGLDISLTGFTDAAIIRLPPETMEDEFDPILPSEPVSRPGQIWQLGRHRLMCGDATNGENMHRLCPEPVALLLTDPPYNVDYTGGTAERLKIQNDRMSDADFLTFLTASFTSAHSVMQPGAPFYIFFPHGPQQLNFLLALNSANLPIHQTLIWIKNQLVLGHSDYQNQHEPILSGAAPEQSHEQLAYGWDPEAGHSWYSDRKQTTLLFFDKPTRSAEHPTMKPVKLISELISNSLEATGCVLDMFGGSGTTLIAAEQLGAVCRMMEVDPHFCDVIIRRWETLTGAKAVLL